MGASSGLLELLDRLFAIWVVRPIEAVLFWDLAFWDNGAPGEIELPCVVIWMILGAVYCTLRFRFVNLRSFRHGLDCVRGVYARADDPGEISHFQALSAALSATVGLGNIAGVAAAVGLGGPGAVLWMALGGFLGMSSKFAECALGQSYRVVRSDGRVSGGPMHYLRDGLRGLGRPGLGRFLALAFAVMCIGGSLGGGNMFQSNQAYAQLASVLPAFGSGAGSLVFGLLMAALVGTVIVGGIRRIGEVAAVLVPLMCGVYLLCGALILIFHAADVPAALGVIWQRAFTLEAGTGGFVGVLIQGFRRAAFSSEAGVGSAAIAHSAASTPEPVREGLVALLEPFIDTIVVCVMTGLVIVVTGAYDHPEAGEKIRMTSWAFAQVFPWFPILLSVTAILFAFSTMVSWSYYGEQCWADLFGVRSIRVYQILFLAFVVLGAVLTPDSVLEFGDLMILGMAFPNLLGVVLLSGQLKRDLDDYQRRLASGEFPRA